MALQKKEVKGMPRKKKQEMEKRDQKEKGKKGGKAQRQQNQDEGYIEEIEVDTFDTNEEI